MPTIHPTALIDPSATLGEEITVGPYAIIEAGVCIGDGGTIHGHAQILTGSSLGENCEVGHASIIGGAPQDLGFSHDTQSGVKIGPSNVFREHTTVHRASSEGADTIIGEGNFFMAGSHVGHDSIVGDRNVLANQVLLGGFVELGNDTFLGGGCAFHQFCRVGDRAMVKGLSQISQDVPPFVMVSDTNQIRGLNVIGLRRAGFSSETRANLKEAYQLIFQKELPLKKALELADSMEWETPAKAFLAFFRGDSKKGICRR